MKHFSYMQDYSFESQNGPQHPNFMINAFLFLVVFVFDFMQAITADEAYKWIWRGLSIISLMLIIYINGHKAKKIFKNRKAKGE